MRNEMPLKEAEVAPHAGGGAGLIIPLSGEITETTIYKGGAVNAGSAVAKIRQGEAADSQLVCYVTLASGKKIAQGMQVLVYPTMVNRQEYGHMEATVAQVDDYVTSPEKLQTQLGDDNARGRAKYSSMMYA